MVDDTLLVVKISGVRKEQTVPNKHNRQQEQLVEYEYPFFITPQDI